MDTRALILLSRALDAEQQGYHVPVTHRAALLLLAARADDAGAIEMSGAELAHWLGVNDQTGRRVLRELRQGNLITLTRAGRGGKVNRYSLLSPEQPTWDNPPLQAPQGPPKCPTGPTGSRI